MKPEHKPKRDQENNITLLSILVQVIRSIIAQNEKDREIPNKSQLIKERLPWENTYNPTKRAMTTEGICV